MKKTTKIKIIKTAILMLCVFFAINIVVFTAKYTIWHLENKSNDKLVEKIFDETKIEDDTNSNVELINPPSDQPNDRYWQYINTPLIDVDFTELKKENNDVVGWIKIEGTNINYPFVQTNNNDYYLNHSFDKKKNSAGWVFLDYRNNIADLQKNTIIYAHGREDDTMFGTLKNILKSKWLDDSNNYIVKLATAQENSLWQVFSVYRIPTTSDYLQTEFISEEEYQTFLKLIKNRSQYDFQTDLANDDQIITLSTCYNKTDKVVLHAKLIKKSSK